MLEEYSQASGSKRSRADYELDYDAVASPDERNSERTLKDNYDISMEKNDEGQKSDGARSAFKFTTSNQGKKNPFEKKNDPFGPFMKKQRSE